MDETYIIKHAGSQMHTDRWTVHAYPGSMYQGSIERPISILREEGDDIHCLELTPDEARQMALALLSAASVA